MSDGVLFRYDDPIFLRTMNLSEYKIVRTTAKGCWVDIGAGVLRFVLSSSRKRLAYPSKNEALVSYIMRKKRQVRILSGRLRVAEQNLALASSVADSMVINGVHAIEQLINDQVDE